MRPWARRAVVAFIVVVATGCATTSHESPTVVLRAADGPLWLYTEEIGRFRCEQGLLVCTDAIGRRSRRFCSCTE
jgi:hypothetical protein